MQTAKEIFSYEDSDLSKFYVKEVYGDGYADVYYAGIGKANARKNGRRKGTNRKGYSVQDSERRGVNDDLRRVTAQAWDINRCMYPREKQPRLIIKSSKKKEENGEMPITEVEKLLISGLKLCGVKKGIGMVILLLLKEEDQQMDMIEYIVEHKQATEQELLNVARRMAAQREERDDSL